ncbi:glycosyl hydrolase family 18 protein [Paenibacillus profundus]|uniref:chitinase n=1 Tax=Paenibacillus profundus TaxID=1173085 RepID=A0ABS8YIA8_9BACL|nr:glycosyl hydrolase family 18 protein [Paenibacillus profundus]MCE5171648.1 glycosyl hydrolase family 18 protein [Paenibacillus profundus]
MKTRRKQSARRLFAMTVMTIMMFVSSLAPAYAGTTVPAAKEPVVKQNSTKEIRNVMYYGDWSIWGGQGNFYPKDIPADQLTHLNYAFLDFDAQGNLVFTDKDAAVGAPVGQDGVQWDAANAGALIALQQLRAENPNLKIGISLGGWSKSGDFSVVTADASKRANLVQNVMKFIKYTNMDFVDVDWEFPAEVRQPDLVDNKNDEGTKYATPEDKNNYILLLQDLKNALNKQGAELGKAYELTVALPAPKKKIDIGIDVPKLFNIVDFANIMTYDMRGAWDEVSGHHTGLYPNPNDPLTGNNLSIDESVNYLIQQGAEPSKIVIGAAYYTRGWDKVSQGSDPNHPGLFGEAALSAKDADYTPSRGAVGESPLVLGDGGRRTGTWSYRNLDKLKATYPNLKEYWDDFAKAPYLYDDTTGVFYTYDNEKSIQEKTKYVLAHGLGGVIAWMAANDAPTTNPAKRDKLTKATKEGLFGSQPLKTHEIQYAKLDVTAAMKPYTEPWGDNKGYEITLVNNESLTESNQVLRAVERGTKTLKLPKLYIQADGPLTSGDYLAGTVTNENGYTVVDLKSVYDAKTIEPGRSYTFKLKGDAEIASMELVQRVSNNSPEMNRQFILGDETPGKNQAPVLHGVSDHTIQVGDVFDKLAGVTATDVEDGDLTSRIAVTGEVNTNLAGKYQLTYSVTDSQGLTAEKARTITVVEAAVSPEYNFGVGEGIEWPKQVNSPFMDMVAWVTKPGYSNNGAPNLVRISEDTGVKFFNLGFIQSISKQIVDGKVQWGWGGYSVLNEKNADNAQYQGIKQSIRELREMGGDVTISLGGLNGVTFWEVTQDTDTLFNTYMELVQGYGLTRLDLDIEGGAQNKALNIANAKAIKKLQDATGVDIVLTLPVLPSGLTSVQLDVLEAYLSAGVDVKVVNIMTMCYGNGTLLPGENYGAASLRAVDSTKNQVKQYFKQFANMDLTEQEAYGIIGTTPSIGFEGEAHPIFTTEWSQWVVDHAIDKGLAMTSFWSINRDAMLENNIGVTAQYQFTDIFKTFGNGSTPPVASKPVIHGATDKTIFVGEQFDPREGVTATDKTDGDLTDRIVIEGTVDSSTPGAYKLVYTVENSQGQQAVAERTITVAEKINNKPVIHGATDKTILVGDHFDPREGVTATDEEDGDLTDRIVIEGTVDSSAPGTYELVYTVEDSQGLQASAERQITVIDGLTDTYDPKKIYYEGDSVIYKGDKYTAKWWVRGEAPDTSQAWKKEVIPNEDGSVDYVPGSVYVEGDLVRYEGTLYQAKWWTQSIPGSDESWKLVE